ncbi:hypothetical protein K439DRAFT_1613054 [Ramaria rubella]|nr:hypothetical protein K439DRAFT_1613054 [Ramaria rubella]
MHGPRHGQPLVLCCAKDMVIVDDEALGEIMVSLRWPELALNRFPVTSTGNLYQNRLKMYFHLHEPTLQASIANAQGGRDDDTALLTEMPLAFRYDFYTIARQTSTFRPQTLQSKVRTMAKVTESAIMNPKFDNDEAPSVILDEMWDYCVDPGLIPTQFLGSETTAPRSWSLHQAS